MVNHWEEIKARLGDHLRYLEGNAKTGGSTLAWMTGVAADIRAALERDDEVRRLIDMAGDWIETDPSLWSTACIEVALDHAKELDSEVVALRQRVEELERSFGLLDQAATDYRRSRDTAEDEVARLRHIVEASERTVLGVHEFSHAKTDLIGRLTRGGE